MQREIEHALEVLVGLPLWGPQRAVNMLSIQAGSERAATTPHLPATGELALQIFCAWRLTSGGTIAAGSGDLYTPADAEADLDTFDWEEPGATWWDLRVLELFSDRGPTSRIVRVSADAIGGFTLECASGVRLEVFPSSSPAPHVDTEFWRLIRPGSDAPHFVVETTGIHHDRGA
jgi:hypothetical protein